MKPNTATLEAETRATIRASQIAKGIRHNEEITSAQA